MTGETVQDWATRHVSIFTDFSTATFGVDVALRDAHQVAAANGLNSPKTRAAFDRIEIACVEVQQVVSSARALPPIPDPSTHVQFHHYVDLRAKWAEAMIRAAQTVNTDDLDRASRFGAEATKEGAAIESDIRAAWPDDDV